MVIENTIPTSEKGVLGWKESFLHSLETMTGCVLEGVLGWKESLSHGLMLGGLYRTDTKTRVLLATTALCILLTVACNFDLRDSRWHLGESFELKQGLVMCAGEYIVDSLESDGVHLVTEEGDKKVWNPDDESLICPDQETKYSTIRKRGDQKSYYPKALHQRVYKFERSYKPKR